jgi:zinc-finger of transposase IS204/IS1001/IS1096/IS1165
VVKRVVEVGDELDLEVELVARAGCCPGCGRASVDVKDRPPVRVRDLPLAGRVAHLVWRKRRYRCAGCGRTFTATHPELPARQRVTRRFRRRCSSWCVVAPPTPRWRATSGRAAIRSRAPSPRRPRPRHQPRLPSRPDVLPNENREGARAYPVRRYRRWDGHRSSLMACWLTLPRSSAAVARTSYRSSSSLGGCSTSPAGASTGCV